MKNVIYVRKETFIRFVGLFINQKKAKVIFSMKPANLMYIFFIS